MKTIDVCDNYAGGGCLKQYYVKNKVDNYKIICMGLNLSVGDIKNGHASFLRTLYEDNTYSYTDSINELLNNLPNSKIRIWSSKGNDDDYLLLLYLCDLLKDKSDNLTVVYTTDYNKYVLSINALHYKEIDSILKYEKQLTLDDINKYSNEWKKLVEINSDLRVLENGIIKNKNYSDYDELILNRLSEIEPCTLVNLVGNLMANFMINDTGSAVYQHLIDRLISLNKIKVIQKGESHFTDIIANN